MADSNFVLSLPTMLNCYDVIESADNADPLLYGYGSLLNGPKYTIYKTSVSSTTHEIVFDFGEVGYSADHVILGRADLFSNADSLELLYSDDGLVYESAVDMTISSANFYGRFNQDQWTTFDTVSSKRFWKAKYTASPSSYFIHSKLFFGELFDFGDEPHEFNSKTIDDNKIFIADDGSRHLRKSADIKSEYSITFKGVTDAILSSFITKIGNRINEDAFGLCAYLLTQTDHQLLNDYRILYVNVVSFEWIKLFNDYNLVQLTCLELS